MILTGDRLILEPLTRADAPALHRLLHDPVTTRYMVLGRTAPSAERWLAELADGWPRQVAWGVKWRSSPRDLPFGVVGLWDLDWLARKAEFRIVLGCPGKGFGTEATRLVVAYAFTALSLMRVWLGTAASNVAAQRCFDRVGFLLEGVLEQDFLTPEGRLENNVRMGLLKTRWEALRSEAARAAATDAPRGAA